MRTATASASATATVTQVSSVSLLSRARSLRAQAGRVNPVLADAYMRRAAELRMQAWAQAARKASTPLDGFAA